MQNRLKMIAVTGLVLAMVLALQMIGLPNLLTGVVVNAVFVFMVGYAGARNAAVIGLLSPVGGLFSGHLPAIMYPLVPVIIIGNLIFIIIYALLRQSVWPVRFFVPAGAKALLIYCVGMAVINHMAIVQKVSWLIFPVLGIQFFTAIAGIFCGEKLRDQVFSEA